MNWSVYALIGAEEKGVTQANVDEFLKSEDPEVQRMLGVNGDFGKMLGLDNKWAYNIIKSVGNYAESLRSQSRSEDPAGPVPRSERALDQGRPALLAALPVI